MTLIQVIEAGRELGLERLSVSAVAMRLGVGVGTIYTYVENRDELRRLVTVALSERPPIDEAGQHWADIVRANAAHDYEILASEPELLRQVVSGSVGPEAGLVALEQFVGLLCVRGFAAADAFELALDSSRIAVGAAVSAAIARSWERDGEPRRIKLARAFAMAPDAYPHVRSLGRTFAEDAQYHDYRPMLERLLGQVASQRGETLPPPNGDAGAGALVRGG